MIEKHLISDKEVWLRIDPIPVERENPNIIPTEYFSASYYLQDPDESNSMEILMLDEEGNVKLFESPVAALGYVSKKLETVI